KGRFSRVFRGSAFPHFPCFTAHRTVFHGSYCPYCPPPSPRPCVPCNARDRLSLTFARGYPNPSRFHFVSMACWSLRSCAPAHAGDLVLAEDPGPGCDGAEALARQSFPTTTERRVTLQR